jgi:ppGpp synthetase/RelA/SpoT-type nucleotidyltranferase
MDLIQSEKLVINELVEIFSERTFQQQFQATAESIKIVFKTLLDDNGEAFDLISKNSVRDIKFYSIIHRIKEVDSIREKFYRSNLLNTDFKDLNLKNRPEVRRNRNVVKQCFKRCDDIIGVKILTDLNQDCKKVLSILKDNESYLASENIDLNRDDLMKQPTKMKNGLEIYKISGTYNSDNKFELQIKSKILSAWGDMEHSIFYKDYFISPVRESTQATMNHIGRLLSQIDNFLSSVRNANKSYEKNAEVTTFLSWFDKEYSEVISDKLGGIGFKIDPISEVLFYVKTANNISEKISRRELQLNHFRYRSSRQRNQDYIAIRNSSFDLKILEAVLLSWLWVPSSIKKSNWDSRLKSYLEVIIEFLGNALQNHFDGYEKREIISLINTYFDEVLKYKPNSRVFLSPKIYIKHIEFVNFVRSEVELSYPSVAERYLRYIHDIDLIFLNFRLNGDCGTQMEDFDYSATEIENLNEILQNLAVSIKVKEKVDFNEEAEYTLKIIKMLNEI